MGKKLLSVVLCAALAASSVPVPAFVAVARAAEPLAPTAAHPNFQRLEDNFEHSLPADGPDAERVRAAMQQWPANPNQNPQNTMNFLAGMVGFRNDRSDPTYQYFMQNGQLTDYAIFLYTYGRQMQLRSMLTPIPAGQQGALPPGVQPGDRWGTPENPIEPPRFNNNPDSNPSYGQMQRFLQEHQRALQQWTQAGGDANERLQSMHQSIQSMQRIYGVALAHNVPIRNGSVIGDSTDLFHLQSMLHALLAGGMAHSPSREPNYSRHMNEGGGVDVRDPQTGSLVMRSNHTGTIEFSIAILNQQKRMNNQMPRPQCPNLPEVPASLRDQFIIVPETGRQNVEMSLWQVCDNFQKIQEIKKALRRLEAQWVSFISGIPFDQLDPTDKDKGADNERRLREATTNINGHRENALDYVRRRPILARIQQAMDQADRYQAVYTQHAEALRGVDYISREQLLDLDRDLQRVANQMSWVQIAFVYVDVHSQAMSIGYELDGFLEDANTTIRARALPVHSPEAEAWRKSVNQTLRTEQERQDYRQGATQLAIRLQRLALVLKRIRQQFEQADLHSGARVPDVNAMLRSSQGERREIGINYAIFTTAIHMARQHRETSTDLAGAAYDTFVAGPLHTGGQVINFFSRLIPFVGRDVIDLGPEPNRSFTPVVMRFLAPIFNPNNESGRILDSVFSTVATPFRAVGNWIGNRVNDVSHLFCQTDVFDMTPSGPSDPSKHWAARYVQDLAKLDTYGPAFTEAMHRIMDGNFRAARDVLLQADADIGSGGAGLEGLRGTFALDRQEPDKRNPNAPKDLSETGRLNAIIQDASKSMQFVSLVNSRASIVINTVVWAASSAVWMLPAYAALKGTSFVFNVIANFAGKTGPISWFARAVAVTADNTAMRMRTLMPRKLAPADPRTYGYALGIPLKLGGAILGFAAFSGIFGAAQAAWDYFFDKNPQRGPDGEIKSLGQRMLEHSLLSMQWATSSWRPIIVFFGVPSTAYERTWLAGPARTLAQKGAVGTASSGLKWVLETRFMQHASIWNMGGLLTLGSPLWARGAANLLSKLTLASWTQIQSTAYKNWFARVGIAVLNPIKSFAVGTLSMVDQVLKFMVFTHVIADVAGYVNFHWGNGTFLVAPEVRSLPIAQPREVGAWRIGALDASRCREWVQCLAEWTNTGISWVNGGFSLATDWLVNPAIGYLRQGVDFLNRHIDFTPWGFGIDKLLNPFLQSAWNPLAKYLNGFIPENKARRDGTKASDFYNVGEYSTVLQMRHAQSVKNHFMEMPLWLLLPHMPAVRPGDMEQGMHAQAGWEKVLREYYKLEADPGGRGLPLLLEVANFREGQAPLKMLGAYRPPLLMDFFSGRFHTIVLRVISGGVSLVSGVLSFFTFGLIPRIRVLEGEQGLRWTPSPDQIAQARRLTLRHLWRQNNGEPATPEQLLRFAQEAMEQAERGAPKYRGLTLNDEVLDLISEMKQELFSGREGVRWRDYAPWRIFTGDWGLNGQVMRFNRTLMNDVYQAGDVMVTVRSKNGSLREVLVLRLDEHGELRVVERDGSLGGLARDAGVPVVRLSGAVERPVHSGPEGKTNRMVTDSEIVDPRLSRGHQGRESLNLTPALRQDIGGLLYRLKAKDIGIPGDLRRMIKNNRDLKQYLDTEQEIMDRGKVVVRLLNRMGEPSLELRRIVKEWEEMASELKGRYKKTNESWDMLIQKDGKMEQLVKDSKSLTALERDYLNAELELLRANHKRMNALNHIDVAEANLNRGLNALIEGYLLEGGRDLNVLSQFQSLRGEAQKLFAKLRAEAQAKLRADPALKMGDVDAVTRLEAVAGKPGHFAEVDPLGALVKNWSSTRSALIENSPLLRRAVAEVKGATGLFRDTKGNVFSGFRPEQFEALMGFFGSLTKGDEPGSLRLFMMLKTGGGKTFLAFEGLLPIAEAKAVREFRKVVFLTVQSNLKAQARAEFRNLNKMLTKLEIDTYDSVKSAEAQAKLSSESIFKKYMILGDEMDGASLQAALSIGRQTAKAPAEYSGRYLLRRTNNVMREMLEAGVENLARTMDVFVQQMRRQAEDLPPNAQRAMNAKIDAIESAVKRYVDAASTGDAAALAEAGTNLNSALSRLGRDPHAPTLGGENLRPLERVPDALRAAEAIRLEAFGKALDELVGALRARDNVAVNRAQDVIRKILENPRGAPGSLTPIELLNLEMTRRFERLEEIVSDASQKISVLNEAIAGMAKEIKGLGDPRLGLDPLKVLELENALKDLAGKRSDAAALARLDAAFQDVVVRLAADKGAALRTSFETVTSRLGEVNRSAGMDPASVLGELRAIRELFRGNRLGNSLQIQELRAAVEGAADAMEGLVARWSSLEKLGLGLRQKTGSNWSGPLVELEGTGPLRQSLTRVRDVLNAFQAAQHFAELETQLSGIARPRASAEQIASHLKAADQALAKLAELRRGDTAYVAEIARLRTELHGLYRGRTLTVPVAQAQGWAQVRLADWAVSAKPAATGGQLPMGGASRPFWRNLEALRRDVAQSLKEAQHFAELDSEIAGINRRSATPKDVEAHLARIDKALDRLAELRAGDAPALKEIAGLKAELAGHRGKPGGLEIWKIDLWAQGRLGGWSRGEQATIRARITQAAGDMYQREFSTLRQQVAERTIETMGRQKRARADSAAPGEAPAWRNILELAEQLRSVADNPRIYLDAFNPGELARQLRFSLKESASLLKRSQVPTEDVVEMLGERAKQARALAATARSSGESFWADMMERHASTLEKQAASLGSSAKASRVDSAMWMLREAVKDMAQFTLTLAGRSDLFAPIYRAGTPAQLAAALKAASQAIDAQLAVTVREPALRGQLLALLNQAKGAASSGDAAALARVERLQKLYDGTADTPAARRRALSELADYLKETGADLPEAFVIASRLNSWGGRLESRGLQARAQLRALDAEIYAELPSRWWFGGGGKPGWEQRVRRLIDRGTDGVGRMELVERATPSESPFYNVYDQMKAATQGWAYGSNALEGKPEAYWTYIERMRASPGRVQANIERISARALGKMQQILEHYKKDASPEGLKRLAQAQKLFDAAQRNVLLWRAWASEMGGIINVGTAAAAADPALDQRFRDLAQAKRSLKALEKALQEGGDEAAIKSRMETVNKDIGRIRGEIEMLAAGKIDQVLQSLSGLQKLAVESLSGSTRQFILQRILKDGLRRMHAEDGGRLRRVELEEEALGRNPAKADLDRVRARSKEIGESLETWSEELDVVEGRLMQMESQIILSGLNILRSNMRSGMIQLHNELEALVAETPGLARARAARVELNGLEKPGFVTRVLQSIGLRGESAKVRLRAEIAPHEGLLRLIDAWTSDLGVFRPRRFWSGAADLVPARRGALETVLTSQRTIVRLNPEKMAELFQKKLDKMTVEFGKKLLAAMDADPLLPIEVVETTRGALRLSVLFPRQSWKSWRWLAKLREVDPGTSWVRSELINLYKGHQDDFGNVTFDSKGKTVVPIHNGEHSPTMDTPTRRFWELKYRSDLTLPYTHDVVVTIKDFLVSRKLRFIGFSGTLGKELRLNISNQRIQISGTGSSAAENVSLRVARNSGEQFQAIAEALRRAAGVRAQAIEQGIWRRATGDGSLVVLSLPNTRVLRQVRQYLINNGVLRPKEIAMVFSDAEALRMRRPEARVARQMNLEGLNNGEVKILMLDTRVGGRGLDLNYKGNKGVASPTAFRGYRYFDMLILDPQEMSAVHLIQAQGRIDPQRVHSYSSRYFTQIINVETAARNPVFRTMMQSDPTFQALAARALQGRQSLAAPPRGPVTWAEINRLVLSLGPNHPLVRAYQQAISHRLAESQHQVELELMRSAQMR